MRTGHKKQALLFDCLSEICNESLGFNKDFLGNALGELRKEDEKGWNGMTLFPEITRDVRNDEIIDDLTGKNLVKYPLKPLYSQNELRRLGILETYNLTAHLANLSIVAHAINEKFHEAIREIFQIDKGTGISKDGSVKYRAGPIKGLVRCRAKTEDDYASEKFPSSSKIIDFVRGSMIFTNCQALAESLKKLKEAIDSQKTCIKSVGRIKNMFSRKIKKGEEIRTFAI